MKLFLNLRMANEYCYGLIIRLRYDIKDKYLILIDKIRDLQGRMEISKMPLIKHINLKLKMKILWGILTNLIRTARIYEKS